MRFRRCDDVLAEVLDDELLLLREGGTDAVRLNSTAAALWEALGSWRTVEALCNEVTDEPDEPEPDEQIVQDVASVLEQLEALQLVIREPGPVGAA